MFVLVLGGNEKIIQVGEDEGETSRDLVYQALERLASVPQTKRHVEEFVQAEWGGERCFRDVCLVDWNLVISTDKIDRGKDCAPCQVPRKVLEWPYGIPVRNGA